MELISVRFGKNEYGMRAFVVLLRMLNKEGISYSTDDKEHWITVHIVKGSV